MIDILQFKQKISTQNNLIDQLKSSKQINIIFEIFKPLSKLNQ